MLTWKDILKFLHDGNPRPKRRVEKTLEEWHAVLTVEQYEITRLKQTEPPGSGDYCHVFEPGIYACVCCGEPLFDSTQKYESGSGWPAFNQPVSPEVIKYKKDTSYGMFRVEILCNTCDAHLGHVFPDGPPPSELRYCVNSASIKLIS